MLRATEFIGGASVPPAPFPSAEGAVQGVWLELGPVLFLTCTPRESSYKCMKSGGHDALTCPE